MRLRLFLVVLGMITIHLGSAWAQEPYSFFIAAGVARPEGIDSTAYFTGGFRWEFTTDWAVEADGGYWKAENIEKQCPGPQCAVYDLRDAHAGLGLYYLAPLGSVDLSIGGGAAAHFRERTADIPRGLELSGTRLGLYFQAGADIPISKHVGVTLAVRGENIFRDEPLDDQSVFKAHAGLRFSFD